MLEPDECLNRVKEPYIQRITVVGRIDTLQFQRAKYHTELITRQFPQMYTKPTIHGYWEMDWLEFRTRYRRLYGGKYYELERPVFCYVDDELIGDDDAIVKHLVGMHQISVVPDYKAVCAKDLKNKLAVLERCHIYFVICIDHTYAGILVFELFNDLVPNTCANFLRLVVKRRRGFTCSIIHRICVPSWIQIGGWHLSKGDMKVPCENYVVAHDRRGILSMCNDGRNNNNTSQCFVTLNPAPWMDNKYVAFGKLILGEQTLQRIEEVETYYEYPLKEIRITECGLYSFSDLLVGKEDSYLRCLLKQAKADIRGPKGDLVKNIRLPGDIVHPKDVRSDFKLQRYVEGLYSFEMDQGSMAWRFPVHGSCSLLRIKEMNKWFEQAVREKCDDASGKRRLLLKQFPPDVLDERDAISTTSIEEFKLTVDFCEQIADNQHDDETKQTSSCPYLKLV